MDETEIIALTQQTILLTIQIATPIMLVGMVVGVAIALLQALTQIQEITLVFVPKIVTIFLTMFLLFPTMAIILTDFMNELADRISGIN